MIRQLIRFLLLSDKRERIAALEAEAKALQAELSALKGQYARIYPDRIEGREE